MGRFHVVFCSCSLFVGGGDQLNYQQYIDFLHEGPSPVLDVTKSEMFLLLASPFYLFKAKPRHVTDSFMFLYFYSFHSDNDLGNNDPNYGRLWKMRHTFNSLNSVYSKYYASYKHLAADEVIMTFQITLFWQGY
jgi:hypothetical protein